tara:strand:- start:897 stop:1505 length:609 start_codon:yes stop_codon:yes gene_type:complete
MSNYTPGNSKNRATASGPSKIVFELDYSDYEKTITKARKEVAEFSKELNSIEKYINAQGGNSKYGKVRIVKGDLAKFATEVSTRTLPAGTVDMQIAAKTAMEPFAIEVRELMRDFVNRVDTGTMKQNIRYQMISSGNIKKLRIEVGWVRLWYKYFDYQENGTRFVVPMKALFNTRLRGEKMFDDAVRKFYRDYILKSGKTRY